MATATEKHVQQESWEFRDDYKSGIAGVYDYATGRCIASICPTEKKKQRGKLIAAAPNLLEALQTAIDCLAGDEAPVPFWVPLARAAIRKATE